MADTHTLEKHAATAAEPTLREMLDEPIAKMLMKCDGVRDQELIALVERIGQHPSRRASALRQAGH